MDIEIKRETKYSFSIQELLYYAFLVCTMGAKALGMTEGQRIFSALIAVGALCVIVKILMTQYTFIEWGINILLLILGVVIYLNTHHLEALFAILMVLGMKNVSIHRACKTALIIWIPCFVLTTGLALLGVRQGFVGVQQKLGMDSAIIRYSLGYTHPNVLHMTFLMIVMLLMYTIRPKGKKLIWTSIILMLINIYIFIYSVSYAGVLSVTFFLGLNIYLSFRKQISKVEKVLLMTFMLGCMLFMITIPFMISDSIRDILDRLINYRLIMINLIFTETKPALFGHSILIKNIHGTLDCSYAYMLMYHGLLGTVLFFISMILVMVEMLNKKELEGVAALSALSLSGVIEQYLANLSFKNIGYFFIGDFICNVLPNRIFKRELVDKYGFFKVTATLDISYLMRKRFDSIIKTWKSVNKHKIFITALLIAILFLVLSLLYPYEPTGIYLVNKTDPDIATVDYEYHEANPIFKDSIIIGNAKEGTMLQRIGWADLSYEKYRLRISVFIWSFLLTSFLLSLFVLWNKFWRINGNE